MDYEQLLDSAYEQVEVCLEQSSDRFEVPRVKGHHMGGRTVISNFLSIASYLRRDPIHMMKFLGKELASQSELQNDRLVLSRKLSSAEVNEKLDKYVCGFVLCPNCKKPDTELNDEGGKAIMKCLACGNRREVHRL